MIRFLLLATVIAPFLVYIFFLVFNFPEVPQSLWLIPIFAAYPIVTIWLSIRGLRGLRGGTAERVNHFETPTVGI